MFGFENRLAINNNLITFNRNDLTGIFVYKIFCPCFQHTGSQFTPNNLLQIGFVHFDIFRQIKNLKNIFIGFKTNCTQQCRNR